MTLFRAFATVGGLTLVSRVLGFVRDLLMAAVLGAGPVADAFFVALRLPNLFRRLFAEGAFAVAFVPLYADALTREGAAAAKAFAERAATLLCVILLPLTVVALAAMPAVVTAIAPGFRAMPEVFDQAVALSRITFPYLMLISLTALLGGVLNAHDRFAPFAAAPVLFNVALIGALGLVAVGPVSDAATALAWATVGAGAAQLIYLAVSADRAGIALRLVRPRLTPKLKRLLLLMGPAALGAGVTQINVFIDTLLASLLPAGAVSFLYYADRLHQLPMGVVGLALATALLPLLSRRWAADDAAGAISVQNRAVEFGLILALPAAVALMVVPGPILAALFERGAFTAADTAASALALAAYAVGLPGTVLIKALSAGFFARQDTATPVRIAIGVTLLNILASILLVWWLPPAVGHAGIALATGLSGWLNTALLARALARQGAFRPDARLKSRIVRLAVAAAIMGAALLGLAALLAPLWQSGEAARLLGLIALVAGGSAVYGVAGVALGGFRIADLRSLRRPGA